MNKTGLKLSALLLVGALATGCVNTAEIEATANRAASDAAAAASAAEAARASADRAAQAAAAAQSTADQALSGATEAQACCEANRESMERMFRSQCLSNLRRRTSIETPRLSRRFLFPARRPSGCHQIEQRFARQDTSPVAPHAHPSRR